MGNLNPIDKRFQKLIKNNQQKVNQQNRAVVNIISDWQQLNPGSFTYQADNILNVNSAELVRFSVGDRIRLVQNSTTKYFQIGKIDNVNNRLEIFAGSDFTYTSNSITEFSFSKLTSPSGFPAAFEFNPNITTSGGAISNLSITAQEFFVIGTQVFITLNASFDVAAPGTGSVTIDLPFESYNYQSTSPTSANGGYGTAQFGAPVYMFALITSPNFDKANINPLNSFFDGVGQSFTLLLQYKLTNN